MQLQIIDILFLLPLLIVGLIASWADWRDGRVRNRLLVAATIYGVFILFLFSLPLGWPDHLRLTSGYLTRAAVNSAIALLAGFLLYKYNFMAPGDAKLFFVFSLLLPLKYYGRAYLPVFPSFTLLVNIFLPLLFYILLQAVWFLTGKAVGFWRGGIRINGGKAIRAAGREALTMIKLAVGMIALYILIQKFSEFIASWLPSLKVNSALAFFIFFVIYRPLSVYMRQHRFLPWAVALITVVFYIVRGWLYERAETVITLHHALEMVVIFLAVIVLARKLLDYYVNNRTTRELDVRDLKAGMHLADIDHKGGARNTFLRVLTDERLIRLKKWARENNITRVRIHQKFPFALWMLLGVITTVVFRQPVLFALGELVNKYFGLGWSFV